MSLTEEQQSIVDSFTALLDDADSETLSTVAESVGASLNDKTTIVPVFLNVLDTDTNEDARKALWDRVGAPLDAGRVGESLDRLTARLRTALLVEAFPDLAAQVAELTPKVKALCVLEGVLNAQASAGAAGDAQAEILQA